MTVGAGISVADDGNLMVLGEKVLNRVPQNVVVTPSSSILNGAFIGVNSDCKGSRRVFPIEKLQAIEKHLQTFSHRERKKMPDVLTWFGWCTWDAFYTRVDSEGVKQGLQSLEKGAIPAKFVIIDDGWQSVAMDPNSSEWKYDFCCQFCNLPNTYQRKSQVSEEWQRGSQRRGSYSGFLSY